MIRIILAIIAASLVTPVCADPFRVATFNTSLSRDGPGELLRDILEGPDPQVTAIARIIKTVRPDILLLNEIDHDYENLALRAFLDVLAQDEESSAGIAYPFFYAPVQNTGLQTGLDMNGDGRVGSAADAQGFGKFRGQYAMALISRFPIDLRGVSDFSELLAKDLPDANLPTYEDGSPFPSSQAQDIQRLSSKGHWDVPVLLPDGRAIHFLASHPTPPVFDGLEDRNGKRNAGEIRFWSDYLDGRVPGQNPPDRFRNFVILGDLNADPVDGEGSHFEINRLLDDHRVQDPEPRSLGAIQASKTQGMVNETHQGDAALDTADWRDAPAPGNLRVDYVLPSVTLRILDSGVFWPEPDDPDFELIASDGNFWSDHRLVWVDLE